MLETRLPLSHVELVMSQPRGPVSLPTWPPSGPRLLNVWVLESVASASSSSWKVAGERPPPVLNEKSCGSSGWESARTTSAPRLRFVNVQVTVSFEETSMFVIGLPSLQVELVRSQPPCTVSASEYPDPGARFA